MRSFSSSSVAGAILAGRDRRLLFVLYLKNHSRSRFGFSCFPHHIVLQNLLLLACKLVFGQYAGVVQIAEQLELRQAVALPAGLWSLRDWLVGIGLRRGWHRHLLGLPACVPSAQV